MPSKLKSLGTPQELIGKSVKKENFLGDGQSYHVYHFTHPQLQDLTLRFPAGREFRILNTKDKAKEIFDKLTWEDFYPVPHPLSDEEALGMPLVRNDNVDIEIQRRVSQPSIGMH